MDGKNDSDSNRPDNRTGVSRRAVLGTAGVLAGVGAVGTANARPVDGDGCQPGHGSSPRPGPPVLYADPAPAPQFENGEGWDAESLLVSGADAYVDGEFLYQDFIYDDYGANTSAAPVPPTPHPDHHDFGPMTGDIVYPTDRVYAHNAADLLEVRCRLTGDGEIMYRFTLNTMLAPDAAAVAVGVDTDGSGQTGETDWGYGLGELGAPADHVLVTWGTGAELDGEPLADDRVSVDVNRNQIEVRVPLTPGEATWRHYLVVGVWNGADGFTQVGEQPTADRPGGAHGQNPPPVFNVGFRSPEQEPMGAPNVEPAEVKREVGQAVVERSGSRGIGYGYWREDAQAKALAARDISKFHADIDFETLQTGTTDRNVPKTGLLNRIYASHYKLDDGTHPPAGVGPYVTSEGDDNNGEDVLRGNLQPYALYVPDDYAGNATPLHVHLHSLSGNHNQYAALTPDFLRQIGERRGTLVLTTTGRGPGVPYDDQAELDLFEAWGDVRARYEVDPDRVTLGGYSMGGIGTHRIASKWPDLFGKGFSIAGSLGGEPYDHAFGDDVYKDQRRIAINQRHVPLLMWQGTTDELAPFPLVLRYEQHLWDLGIRHEFDIFPGFDHLSFGYLDDWGPAARFLDKATVTDRPRRITYRRVPRLDNTNLDLVHDQVYWVSDIEVADDAADGLVDAHSAAFGEGAPVVERYRRPGTEPYPHVKRGVEWADPTVDPAADNALSLSLTDVTALTVWVEEAELDASDPIKLTVDATHETTVTLASNRGRTAVTVPAGHTERTVRICGVDSDRPHIETTRADDGRVFTGGQTDHVDITVDANRSVRVRDRIPDGWSVVGGDATRTYPIDRDTHGEEAGDGARYVEFLAPVRKGTLTYFLEVPAGAGETGQYTLGPLEVEAGDGWTEVAGTTDENWVVGLDTSA